MKGHQPACSTRITEGMKVVTDNEGIRRSRKMALDLLLSNQVNEEIFDPYFNNLPTGQVPEFVNLLFAREECGRSVGLGEAGAVCSGSGCTFDFS